jgi:hypothetical protein
VDVVDTCAVVVANGELAVVKRDTDVKRREVDSETEFEFISTTEKECRSDNVR